MGGWWSQTQEEDSPPPEEATSSRTHHRTDSQEELRDVPPQEKSTDSQDLSRRMSMPVVPSLEELVRDVPAEKLDQPCADEHLCEIALSVTKWQSVAPFLGLTEAEEEEIKKDCTETSIQRIKMLRRWRQKFGRLATYRKLAEVFSGLGQAVLVEKVCELLQESESSEEFYDAEENLPATFPPGQCPDEDVQEQQVVPHEPENPAIAAYAEYLRVRYVTQNPTFLTLQWPTPRTRKVFNLVMILGDNAARGPIDKRFAQLILRGKVDDILHGKKAVRVEDIFKLDVEFRKLIVIEGAPGAGKSTLAWHITQSWARGELFQEFKVVVFIQLRDPTVRCAQSLADLLPARSRATAKNVAHQLCASDGRNSLFILDSWDEFSPHLKPGSVFDDLIFYPENLNLHFRAVLITTRPIASGVLYPYISSRIEIIGFTHTERRLYFTEALKQNSQNIQKLEYCLSKRPVIDNSCYLPLNAAIIAHLFITSNQTLPTTLHGVFFSLVKCCLIRHMRREGREKEITCSSNTSSFENFPNDIREQLRNLCKLAYYGVMDSRATFSASDLQSFSLPTELSTLSLVQGVECDEPFGKAIVYNFLHLSIQELLAAFHISEEREEKQISIFKELFGQPRFAAVFQYYAAFTKLQSKGIQDIIRNIVKSEKANTGPKSFLVNLLHCLFETQDQSLYQFVASQLNGELNLSQTSLSPVDCLAVGYFLCSVCLTSSGEFKVDLKNCSLDGSSICFLARELSKCSSSSDTQSIVFTGCLNLDFSGIQIRGHGAKSIAQLLSQCSLVRKLILDSCTCLQIGEDGFCCLLQTLTANSSLVHLSLEWCSLKITKDNGPVLAQMLLTNKTLESLKLSWNNVSDIGAFYLAEGLKQNTGLKELSAWKCTITGKGARFLSDALIANTSLVNLEIGGNDLAGDGIAHISHSLEYNTTLTQLNLGNCELTEKDTDLLAQVLKVNMSIVTLNLSYNNLGNNGIAQICSVMHTNTTLTKLFLTECNLTEKDVEPLAQALKENKSLCVLWMENNWILTGVTCIGDALRNNQSLKSLNVSNCGISDKGIESFATSLTMNDTLEELILSHNQSVTDNGLVDLGDSLTKNRGLLRLKLQGLNKVTAEGLRLFVLCLKGNCYLNELWVGGTADGAETVQHETELVILT